MKLMSSRLRTAKRKQFFSQMWNSLLKKAVVATSTGSFQRVLEKHLEQRHQGQWDRQGWLPSGLVLNRRLTTLFPNFSTPLGQQEVSNMSTPLNFGVDSSDALRSATSLGVKQCAGAGSCRDSTPLR